MATDRGLDATGDIISHECDHGGLDHEPIEIAGNDDWAVMSLGPCMIEGCPCRGTTSERDPDWPSGHGMD